MKTDIINQQGAVVKSFNLPEEVFGLSWNADLVHQVVTSMMSSARSNVAHAKDRSEVRGGGKKPWKQKGTGRARHGSTRSPIWVGGGKAHGPRNDKNYDRKVNKKMKVKALFTILSKKFKDNEILFVDSLGLSTPKTKDAKAILTSFGGMKGFERMSTKKVNTALFALNDKNNAVEKSFQNFGNISIAEVRSLNPVDVLNYKYLVVVNPEESIKTLSGKMIASLDEKTENVEAK